MGRKYTSKAMIYNNLLPHYQYAYSLLKEGTNFMPDFVTTNNGGNTEKSMQVLHNMAHNNLSIFMSDAAFSITNLFFFLYHSWIDLALETKIRLIRQDPKENRKQLKATNDYLNQIKPKTTLDQPPHPGFKYNEYYIY